MEMIKIEGFRRYFFSYRYDNGNIENFDVCNIEDDSYYMTGNRDINIPVDVLDVKKIEYFLSKEMMYKVNWANDLYKYLLSISVEKKVCNCFNDLDIWTILNLTDEDYNKICTCK